METDFSSKGAMVGIVSLGILLGVLVNYAAVKAVMLKGEVLPMRM
jgi:hypothetical protein